MKSILSPALMIGVLSADFQSATCSFSSVSIWSLFKKKPLCVEAKAHGDSWICALGVIRFSDVFASGEHSRHNSQLRCVALGASDGFVRVWRVAQDFKSVQLVHSVAIVGLLSCVHT